MQVYKMTFGTPEKITPMLYKEPSKIPLSGTTGFDVHKIDFKAGPRGCRIEFPLEADEEIFGFGLQLKGFNHKGTKKYLRPNADPVANTGDSHAPVPFCVTTKGFGFYVDTARYASYYCGRGKNKDRTSTAAGEIGTSVQELYKKRNAAETTMMVIDIPVAQGVDLYIFEGGNITETVSAYNLFSGGGCMPALWGLGVFYRCFTKFTATQVLQMADYFREKSIPCDIIGLEPGWQSNSYSCSFTWNEQNYPHPAETMAELQKKHFHVNLWEHAFVNAASPLYKPLHDLSGDYEVWKGLVPDFASEKAVQLFADYHKKALVDLGVTGFKLDECDGSDYTGSWTYPNCSEFPSGLDGEQMHSLIGTLYQKTILQALGDIRTLSEVRSAGALAAPYPFVLYSDLYDHKDFIRGVVNSGFSGLLWAPEVRRVSSREELIRRIQSVVFSPQALINAWHIDRAPWLDYDVEDEVRRLFECRMQLVPYLYAAFYQYYKAGKAPVRALVSDYTDDPNTYTIDDEYLFGDGMLVAPIIAGEESRTVYLPQGTWYDFWTHKPYNAGYHEVRQEDIPIFVKGNTVLPLARPVQYIEPDTKFLLDVVCFGKQGEITLVEDDGVTTGTVYKEHKLAFNGQSVVSLEENSRYEIAGTQFVR